MDKTNEWQWKDFCEEYGMRMVIRLRRLPPVGGDSFDITQMTAEERKKYSYDKTDPMEGMGVSGSDGEPDPDIE